MSLAITPGLCNDFDSIRGLKPSVHTPWLQTRRSGDRRSLSVDSRRSIAPGVLIAGGVLCQHCGDAADGGDEAVGFIKGVVQGKRGSDGAFDAESFH